MAMEMITPTIVGTRALMMSKTTQMNRHNALTKQWNAIKGKRKKTDQEMDELEHLQWQMSLYYDPKMGPILPTQNILASAIQGARQFKEGKLVEGFVTFIEGDVPLNYNGPRDAETMWKTGHFTDASPTKRGVVAVRPLFRDWSATFTVSLDTAGIEVRDFLRHLVRAGSVIGVGSWRKRYGRFRVELDDRVVEADGSLGGKFQEGA